MKRIEKILLSFVLVLFHSQSQSSETPIPGVISKLSGTWNEVVLSEPDCTNKKYFHKFSASPDGLTLKVKYLKPFESIAQTITEKRYRIIYGDDKSVTLYLEGEEFEHADTGDKVIRQLILENDKTYAWRLIGKPKEFRAAGGGILCKE